MYNACGNDNYSSGWIDGYVAGRDSMDIWHVALCGWMVGAACVGLVWLLLGK